MELKEKTSLATFATDRLQNISLQFSHVCALFCLHVEGGISHQELFSFREIGTKHLEYDTPFAGGYEICQANFTST